MKKRTFEELLVLAKEGIWYNKTKDPFEEEVKSQIWEYNTLMVDWLRKAEPNNLILIQYIYFVFEEQEKYILTADDFLYLIEEDVAFSNYRVLKTDGAFYDYLDTKLEQKKKIFFQLLLMEE